MCSIRVKNWLLGSPSEQFISPHISDLWSCALWPPDLLGRPHSRRDLRLRLLQESSAHALGGQVVPRRPPEGLRFHSVQRPGAAREHLLLAVVLLAPQVYRGGWWRVNSTENKTICLLIAWCWVRIWAFAIAYCQ